MALLTVLLFTIVLVNRGGAFDDVLTKDLITAVQITQEEKAKELVRAGADPNGRDEDDRTVLMHAVFSNNSVDLIRFLIDQGADVMGRNTKGETPLHWAGFTQSNPEVLDLLLGRGADIDAKDKDKWTPLHIASLTGNLVALKWLVDNGANLNAVSIGDATPLDVAIDEEKKESAHFLVKAIRIQNKVSRRDSTPSPSPPARCPSVTCPAPTTTCPTCTCPDVLWEVSHSTQFSKSILKYSPKSENFNFGAALDEFFGTTKQGCDGKGLFSGANLFSRGGDGSSGGVGSDNGHGGNEVNYGAAQTGPAGSINHGTGNTASAGTNKKVNNSSR